MYPSLPSPSRTARRSVLRPIVALFSFAALACLISGIVLFSSAQTNSSSDLRTAATAIGLVVASVLCERLAVALAFAHSSRRRGQLSSLLLVLFCLLMMLDSLFFTLRVRGDVHVSWRLFGLPIEEALPPLEVAVFAPLALGYGLWPVLRHLPHRLAVAARAAGATLATHSALQRPRAGAHA